MPNSSPPGSTEPATDTVERHLKLLDDGALLELLSPRPIGAESVDSTPILASVQPNLSFGPFQRLTLNARSALSIRALNGPEDVDEDGIAAAPKEKPDPPGSDLELTPQLLLTKTENAWLKYALEAGLKAEGSGAASLLSFKFAGEAAVGLLDYRAHAREEPVVDAVSADLKHGLRFAVHLGDVFDLSHGDCVAQRLRGSLQASATVSCSDVFATHLGEVLSRMNVKTPVTLKVSAGAKLTGSISVQDDFIVAFTRLDQTHWRVAVKKADKRGIQVRGQAGVAVTFANPGDIAGLLDSYLSGLLGAPLAKVEEVLAKGSLARLSAEERRIVESVLDRLGLGEIPEALADLQARITAVEEKAREVVETVAKAKLTAGFTYEYDRVSTETVLFQSRVTRDALEKHHADLVWGRLGGALASPPTEVAIERYLNEKTSVRSASWGFSLGLHKWVIAGRDARRLERVERRDMRDRVQRSYVGARRYAARWIGSDWSWDVDFRADMREFSADLKPKLSEYAYGLSVAWHQGGGGLSTEDIDQLLDMAALWRVTDGEHLAAAREALQAALDKRYRAVVQLVFGREVFQALLPALAEPADANVPRVASALAEAMPYWKKTRPLTLEQRRQAYAPLWEYYLRTPKAPPDQMLKAVVRTLEAQPQGARLARLEANYLGSRPFTFMGLVELNDGTPERFERMTHGFRSLRDGLRNGEYDEDDRVPKIFDDLRAFWGQSHHVRAFGAYLLAAAARQQVLYDVKRSVTLEPEGSDRIVIASA